MAITLEALAERLEALEREVTHLRELLERPPASGTALERGIQMLRDAPAAQAALSAGWAKAMKEMGITGEPVGAEKLQQMMIEAGINPNDNQFSRGIIEMREE